jgi:LPS-assembly lipoprotein
MVAARHDVRRLAWHRLAGSVVASLLLLNLAGCGFRPIYGSAANDLNGDGGHESSQAGGVKAALAQVKIGLIPDRSGQQLRNQLLDLMNAGGEPSRPVYRLDITLTTEKTALATRSDASVSLSRLRTVLRYKLVAIHQTAEVGNAEAAAKDAAPRSAMTTAAMDSSVLDQGTLTASTSYNVLDSLFASKAAEDDALARSLKDLAYQVTDAVAIALQQPKPAPAAPPEPPKPESPKLESPKP